LRRSKVRVDDFVPFVRSRAQESEQTPSAQPGACANCESAVGLSLHFGRPGCIESVNYASEAYVPLRGSSTKIRRFHWIRAGISSLTSDVQIG
jgi:hypothetical protein